MNPISDASAERLVKLYSRAERDILAATNKALLRGNSTRHLNALLNQVKTIRADLLEGARTWTDTAIPLAYQLGADDTGLAIVGSFSKIDQQAMKILADNVFGRFEQVDQVIGRKIADIYRSVTLENITGSISGYETWKQAAKNIREGLADQGITGFVDAAGREWNIETYSEMVARTGIAQIQRTAAKNRIMSHGHRLAQITEGASAVTCEACDDWAGEVVSLTGDYEGDYPPLEEAEDAGCFHPNCVHRLVAAIEEEQALDEEEADQEAEG